MGIDQRTKIDHGRSHMDRAGVLATGYHFSAADRKDCAAYDALCDYFVEKQRVGLVQTPSYYVYIVPPKVKLYKMGEFCCNIVANYVQGKEAPEHLTPKLHIDQRTKIDHCKSHMERAGPLATIWHFSAADRKDCAA